MILVGNVIEMVVLFFGVLLIFKELLFVLVNVFVKGSFSFVFFS